MDVFPRLLEGDVPFYSHEIDAYWNDIGNLEELRESTFDALTGAVEVEREGELVDGFRSGDAERRRGRAGRPGADRRRVPRSATTSVSTGPSVIGDGVRIGAGCRLREVIALPGAEIAAGSVLVGAIAGASRS